KKNASLPANPLPKYLWIRLALFEKQLAKIIDYLVSNANKYYDKDAPVADPTTGASRVRAGCGPCALDYSRTKTPDHFRTDPPADELVCDTSAPCNRNVTGQSNQAAVTHVKERRHQVQRHRIPSGHSTPPSVSPPHPQLPPLAQRQLQDSITNRTTTQHFAKDYVESLHQNSRATLLFGKNNVLVLPVNADVSQPMPGYLSLHQTASGLTIKWTPNQLMNGFTDEVQDKRQERPVGRLWLINCCSVYWDYALQVRLDEIVYVHCHQDSETGGTVILVGQDGVQRPPIHFPKGGHMLAFLSCIETGLLPRGRLDPPLWSQRSGTSSNKRRRPLPALSETEETTKDYVFRIADNSTHKDMLKRNELMDTHISLPPKSRVQLPSTSTSSESSTKSFSIDQNAPDSPPSICIQAVCDSMKRQIISRAFYGWLAYCRHLSTVRTHLSGLVNSKIVSGEGAADGITADKWNELCVDGVVSDHQEVYRLAYFGGVAQDLRKELWPYLLGHYKFGTTTEQRVELGEETRQAYENTMSEWLAVEAIVKQKDKETQANAIAKLSSESMSGEQVPAQIQRELSNEALEDTLSDDDSDDDKPKKTRQNTIKYESDQEDGEARQEWTRRTSNSKTSCTTASTATTWTPSPRRARRWTPAWRRTGLAPPAMSACVSPASSNGGVYSQELLETFGLNLNPDREGRSGATATTGTSPTPTSATCKACATWWRPSWSSSTTSPSPTRASATGWSAWVENPPNGNAMDCHFANMRSLIQILDSERCTSRCTRTATTPTSTSASRWFLLDFKRELVYSDAYATWEVIWAAQHVASSHFVLFPGPRPPETHRATILSNCMDFTDIIKFFNEMAERHDDTAVLAPARDPVLQPQPLIENK
ncbi:hypothetical protein MTP99_006154, partial [Tenebrio molitor]